jgi:hypothetical protein
MRHMHLRNNQYRGQEDRRDLSPEGHAPAETVGYGSAHHCAKSRAGAEEDVDPALVQPAVGEGDEVGDDDGLESESGGDKSATAQQRKGTEKSKSGCKVIGSGQVGFSGKVVEQGTGSSRVRFSGKVQERRKGRRKHVSQAYVTTTLWICRSHRQPPLTVTVNNPPLPAPAIHLATRIKFIDGAMAHMSVPAATVSDEDIRRAQLGDTSRTVVTVAWLRRTRTSPRGTYYVVGRIEARSAGMDCKGKIPPGQLGLGLGLRLGKRGLATQRTEEEAQSQHHSSFTAHDLGETAVERCHRCQAEEVTCPEP